MKKNQITEEQISIFRTAIPLFDSLYKEVSMLAQKKPDGTVNKTKVALVNRLLEDLKTVLSKEDHDKYLDILDDDTLPQYSDVLLVMSQYKASLKEFSHRYYYSDVAYGPSTWHRSPKKA